MKFLSLRLDVRESLREKVNNFDITFGALFQVRFSDPDRSLNRKKERFKVFEVELRTNRGQTVMTS